MRRKNERLKERVGERSENEKRKEEKLTEQNIEGKKYIREKE